MKNFFENLFLLKWFVVFFLYVLAVKNLVEPRPISLVPTATLVQFSR